MSIVCSGYINNTLLFITKENELYSLGSSPQPLSNITGYPNARFDGLCSYSTDTLSMYLSFTSETTSTIYQLHLTDPPQFSATSIVLQNAILHSFEYIQGQNNTYNMAYISTKDQHLTLTLQNLNNITQLTSKPMQERAVLAVSGNTLYVIESHFIEHYRFDHLDYCNTPFVSSINNQTTGTVITSNQTQYIGLYHAGNTQLDIYKHDTLLSNYTKLPTASDYLSFNPVNATQIPTSSELNSTQTGATTGSATTTASANSLAGEGSEASTKKRTTTTRTASTASPTVMSTASIIDINGESKLATQAPSKLLKRGITPEDTQVSSDSSYTVQKTTISSEEGLPVVMAILDTSDDVFQNPPYNVLVLEGDSAQGYHIYSYPGSNLAQNSLNDRGLSGGAIAGIVIGIIAFILLVVGALYYTKRRKGDKHSVQRTYRSMPLSIQPTDVQTPYMTTVNHSQTSSILHETALVPDEYRDTSRPYIRPLTYDGTHIKSAELSNSELQTLEPDVSGPLYLFSGKYTSTAEETVTYLRDGYAVRTFHSEDGIKHTIHYFSASNLKTFVQSVNAVLHCTAKDNQYIMKSKEGIVLCKPTPHFNYQYIWITSPMIPEHSLYYLLFERKTWTFVDHHNPDYKIWSVYAVLKSVEILHASKFVHLAIDLKSFYYDDETKATDWRLGNFGYAQPFGQATETLAPYTAFTSPEIIRNGSSSGEPSDIWSLACVIYTIATGGGLLFENDIQVKNLITFNDDMKQHLKISIRDNIENQVFKSILQDMLKVDPTERKSIAKVLDDWNLTYNMEE